MQLDTNYGLIIFGIILIAIDVILGAALGFELLIIGVILLVAGGIGILSGSVAYALTAAIILTLVYVIAGRKYIRNTFNIDTKKTNMDDLIGKKALVVKEISPGKPGQVKIDGEIWRASSKKHHDVEAEVTVESISGVTVHIN